MNLADLSEWNARARQSLADGGQAFERLLALTETGSDSGQASVVASFIATCLGFAKFDIYDLRRLDVNLSDDVMTCIDTIRWGQTHLSNLVPEGMARAHAVCVMWGFAKAEN